MPVSVAKSSQRHNRTLNEQVRASVNPFELIEIDRDAGVIKNVRVLGPVSPNNHSIRGAKSTRYTEAAMKSAIPLYENAHVSLNHRPLRSREDKPVQEKIGVLRNVHYADDGIRGDLHYLKAHPFAAQLLEDVERGLGVYSLSHDAQGEGQVKDGVFVIDRITEVRSVDLVDRGATTTSLAESRSTTIMNTTFRKLLEQKTLAVGLTSNRGRWGARLLEMPYMSDKPVKEQGEPEPMGGLEVEAPAETDPDAALASGFESALQACVKQFVAGDLSDADFLSKIKELAKTFSKLTGAAEPEAPTQEMEKTEEEKAKETKESLQRDVEVHKLRSENEAINLMESLSFKGTKVQREAVIALPAAQRRAFIMEAMAQVNRPRSGGSAPDTFLKNQQQNAKPAETAAELAKRLKSAR